MVEPCKRMHVSDEDELCELLQDNKRSDISETECIGDSGIKFSYLINEQFQHIDIYLIFIL
jgi:hypothetical protein